MNKLSYFNHIINCVVPFYLNSSLFIYTNEFSSCVGEEIFDLTAIQSYEENIVIETGLELFWYPVNRIKINNLYKLYQWIVCIVL